MEFQSLGAAFPLFLPRVPVRVAGPLLKIAKPSQVHMREWSLSESCIGPNLHRSKPVLWIVPRNRLIAGGTLLTRELHASFKQYLPGSKSHQTQWGLQIGLQLQMGEGDLPLPWAQWWSLCKAFSPSLYNIMRRQYWPTLQSCCKMKNRKCYINAKYLFIGCCYFLTLWKLYVYNSALCFL